MILTPEQIDVILHILKNQNVPQEYLDHLVQTLRSSPIFVKEETQMIGKFMDNITHETIITSSRCLLMSGILLGYLIYETLTKTQESIN